MTNQANESTPGARLLCVEDDEENCEALATVLRASGYEVTTAATVSQGLQLAREGGFGLIILDNWFKESSGIKLCQRIREFDRETPIIFYSAAAYDTDTQEGLDAGAQAYIIKPHFEEFQRAVARLAKAGKIDT